MFVEYWLIFDPIADFLPYRNFRASIFSLFVCSADHRRLDSLEFKYYFLIVVSKLNWKVEGNLVKTYIGYNVFIRF